MAFVLEVAIIDGGDATIKVIHSFYGVSEEEVETYKREHIGTCEYFRSAVQEGRVIESLDEIDDDDLPEVEDYEDEDLEDGG